MSGGAGLSVWWESPAPAKKHDGFVPDGAYPTGRVALSGMLDGVELTTLAKIAPLETRPRHVDGLQEPMTSFNPVLNHGAAVVSTADSWQFF